LKNAAKRVMQGQRTGTLSWIYYARSTLQLQAVVLVKKGNLLTKSLLIDLLNSLTLALSPQKITKKQELQSNPC
jgi:hypothetical protein